MNNKLSKLKYIAIFLAGISATSIPVIARAEWSISAISFRDSNNHVEARAFDINNMGQVAGYYQGTHGQEAFIVGPDGAVEGATLGTIGGKSSVAFAINDSGQMTGSSNDNIHAFITGPNGVGTTDLGTLGGFYSGGYGINNSGQVVGYSYTNTSSSNPHAFITGPNGEEMADLGTLGGGGGSNSFAYGINDTGQVVGYSYIGGSTSSTHAFITGPNGVGMTDLGTLGGRESYAYGINNYGQVAGASTIAGEKERHAFITGPNGEGMIDLGTFGGINSEATDINNSGQAVGFYRSTSIHAFLYSGGEMIDLSKLGEVVAAGWTDLFTAEGINDYGQIVGVGILHGQLEAYVLSPFSILPYPVTTVAVSSIPEPETYAMLLVGLGLIGFMARQKAIMRG